MACSAGLLQHAPSQTSPSLPAAPRRSCEQWHAECRCVTCSTSSSTALGRTLGSALPTSGCKASVCMLSSIGIRLNVKKGYYRRQCACRDGFSSWPRKFLVRDGAGAVGVRRRPVVMRCLQPSQALWYTWMRRLSPLSSICRDVFRFCVSDCNGSDAMTGCVSGSLHQCQSATIMDPGRSGKWLAQFSQLSISVN